MNGLPIADVAVIIGYLAGITWLGVYLGRRVRRDTDFFMPRRFGKGMMMMHAFGTGTASDQAVVVTAGIFRNGLSGIWFQWLWLFNTPFYWLIAPVFRRLRATTTSDVYALRFGPSASVLFAVVGIIGLSVKIGLLLKGAGALIESGSNGAVSAGVAVPAVAVLFVLYGVAGGLGAAIVTDYVQGLLTIVFSFMLLPWVLSSVGGLQGIRSTLDNPELLTLVAPEGITPFFIATFSVLSLAGIVAQPFIMGVCAAGRTEMDGRFGFVAGNLIKRVCTAAWAVTGIAALAWYVGQGTDPASINPDEVYGSIAAEFLPRAFPGLLGLFIASLLAGIMSSCDSMMIAAAALFTENLYRPLARNRDESHYLLVGRIISVAIVIGGVIFAFRIPSVVAALKTWLKIAPMLGVGFWMGLFWRRFNLAGLWAGTLAGFGSWWLSTRASVVAFLDSTALGDSLKLIDSSGPVTQMSEPWQIVFYLSAAVVAGIIASLLTPPVDSGRIRRFHELIRTPVQPGEVITASCQLPEGVEPAQRAVWFKGTSFEFPSPSRMSILGFLLSWVAVAFLILSFKWVMNQ
jgi:Na+/proline symporter